MSEREKTIAEIQEALKKATPGPWKIDEFGAVIDRKGNLIQWYDGKVVTAQKEDAHLIANAPTWLRFLLTELSDAQEQNRKLIEERDFWKDEYAVTVAKENEKLREERDTIYADWNKEKDKQIQLTYELLTAQQEIERLRKELERIKCSNCGNEGIYETGIEKDGLRETKFCGLCVYGERAKMMHELRSALFENEEENRKMREERDFWKDEYAVTVAKENEKLRDQLQSAQAEVERLRQELAEAQEHYGAMESLWFRAKSELAEKDEVKAE